MAALDPIQGNCFPANNVKNFSANLNIIVFISVDCKRKLTCTGNCDDLQVSSPGCNQETDCSYIISGGNFSFTFKFSRLGDGYICNNMNQFATKWAAFNTQVQEKIDANKMDQTTTWPNGVCDKTVPNGVDCNGNPKFKKISNPLTRSFNVKKTPSTQVNKSITSQAASCTFN